MEKNKIKEPKLGIHLDVYPLEALIEEDISGQFRENPEKEVIICDKTIDGCVFHHIDFSSVKLENVDLVDVIFDGCDLSNQCFEKKYLYRVIFRNCKMIGTSFVDASIHDVQFENCLTRYLNFAGAKITGISILDSEFREASFLENEIKNMSLEQVRFLEAEFMRTKLAGVDFSTCDITSTMFDFYSLKGIIVDAFQCQFLVSMLGVEIKE